MLDANAATMSRPVALVKISSNASVTSRSDPVKPRRSIFVLSANNASTPSAPSCAKRWTSNGSPSIGVWSILKSPVCTTTPAGVWNQMRHPADVILVPMSQHEGRDAPFLLQVREIRNDQIDAEQVGVGKHHACVDH